MNRQQRRHFAFSVLKSGNKETNKLYTSGMGKKVTQDGKVVRIAGDLQDGGTQYSGCWANLAEYEIPYKNNDPETVNIGVINTRHNAELIRKSKGINHLIETLEKKDVFFLIGAGRSVVDCIESLPHLSRYGTVIAANQALKLFCGKEECLDFAFMIDSRAKTFTTREWWARFDKQKVNLITSFNTAPEVMTFKNHFFQGQGDGYIPEWREAVEKHIPDYASYGKTECGWNWFYSALHFCYQVNPKATIVSIGNDFSFIDNWKYFDSKHILEQEGPKALQNSFWKLILAQNEKGETIVTNKDLETQCKSCVVACANFEEAGGKVINASPGGIFYSDKMGIIQKSLVEVLREL